MYEGGRDYESIAAFAKQQLVKPVCSVANMQFCNEDEIAIINSLRNKPQVDLEAVEGVVNERVEAAQAVYDAAFAELTSRYEEITNNFNSNIDEIRAATNFKWVQQILSLSVAEDGVNGGREEL